MHRMATDSAPTLRHLAIASYVLAALALFLVLQLHLLPALLAGLLVYELVVTLTPPLQRWVPGDRARWLVVLALTIVLVGLLILLVLGIISILHHELGNPRDFWREQAMPLVDRARTQLPPWIVNHLPDSVESLRVNTMEWLRAHAGGLRLAGKEATRVLAHILIGLVLGAIVALGRTRASHRSGPLARVLGMRCARLAEAFHNIVFAQVKISALNTVLTAIFLLVVLPLLGVQLPLAKTLVLVSFIAGLLPVIGNLISNTIITVVALSVSLGTAVAALVFLVCIHKLEYFLNARIVGTQIRARAWELLVAMLAMEAAFGLPGVIAAPIFYAYLKRELEAAKLV
jgi:predicted PurR-regulated permease PerM